MSSRFKDAFSFNKPLRNWNLNNVTDMNCMFCHATSFNQPLNNWNVRNVTDMNNMFYRASSFNQPLNNWNVSKVTTMERMFAYATSFNQPLCSWVINDECVPYSSSQFNVVLMSWCSLRCDYNILTSSSWNNMVWIELKMESKANNEVLNYLDRNNLFSSFQQYDGVKARSTR